MPSSNPTSVTPRAIAACRKSGGSNREAAISLSDRPTEPDWKTDDRAIAREQTHVIA
jgi:hypothetical protein